MRKWTFPLKSLSFRKPVQYIDSNYIIEGEVLAIFFKEDELQRLTINRQSYGGHPDPIDQLGIEDEAEQLN